MNDWQKSIYSSKRIMGEIYLGRDVEGQSAANILRAKEKENKALANEDCLQQIDDYLGSLKKYGEVIMYEKTNSPAFNRFEIMHNYSSENELSQLLGYKKKVFVQEYVGYNIYTKNKTEQKETGKYNAVYNYSSQEIASFEAEKRSYDYKEYYYQEEMCQIEIEIYFKVVNCDIVDLIKKENEFISEHDYYLSKDKEINNNGAKKGILNVFIPFCMTLLFSLLFLVFSCFAKGGYYIYWNYDTIEWKIINKIHYMQNLISNNTFLFMVIFIVLEICFGVYTVFAIRNFSKIKAGKKNGDLIGLTIKRFTIVVILYSVFVLITVLLGKINKIFYGDPNWSDFKSDMCDLGLWLFKIFKFVLSYTRVLFVIFNIVLFVVYLYGTYTKGFGMLNNINNDIELYNKKLNEMKTNGRFEELEKLKKEILKSIVHVK